MPTDDPGKPKCLPIKVLTGIPNHMTYRRKLEWKWRRKGFSVRFA